MRYCYQLKFNTAESVRPRRKLSKFRTKLGGMPQPRLIVIPIRAKRLESVPTRRTLCKFLLNLGEMPLPRLNFIGQIQNGKEGLPQT